MTYVCQCMPTGLYQRPAVCMSVYACTHVKEPLLPFVRVGVTPDNIVSIFSQQSNHSYLRHHFTIHTISKFSKQCIEHQKYQQLSFIMLTPKMTLNSKKKNIKIACTRVNRDFVCTKLGAQNVRDSVMPQLLITSKHACIVIKWEMHITLQ